MFIDVRTLDNNSTIESDICIMGAGPAGITLARSLESTGKKICILESGGLKFEQATQDLNQGKSLGLLHFGYLWASRARLFGGSTNFWGGFCAPLKDYDFEKRDWVPYSGWPITKESLDSYYTEAQKILQLGPYDYDVKSWLKNDRKMDFPGNKILPDMWQRSSVNFGKTYKKDMEKSKNIHVYFHTNVTKIHTNNSAKHITHLDIKTLEGKTHTAKAKTFIMACGGIENTRILLLSNDVAKNGLGNENDLVGRFFMDHPHTISAKVMLNDVSMYKLNDKAKKGRVRIYPSLVFSRETQEKEKLLNSAFTISHGETDWQSRTNVESAHQIWPLMQKFTNTVLRKEPRVTRVYGFSEQAPNRDSRLFLTEDKDALGINKIALDWQLNSLDRHSLKRSLHIFAEELGRHGIGRMKIDDWLLNTDGWPKGNAEDDNHKAVTGHAHHAGTTKMSETPKTGVVDKNCKLHSIDNLYIASSSIFPTVGWANPTLTIVALSLRLSDHLKQVA